MSIAEGQSLGNYRILARIGVGGMGAVYLAEHPLIGKKVALKVIHRDLAGNQEVISRFFNEARAVNKIGNEHIVEIHDFGMSPEGEHFYIMEYLEGRTLAQVLSHERVIDVQRALHIAAQIAHALAAAHACGIIHRDLKPDNIMLVPRLGTSDFVKVLDFGLARTFAADGNQRLTAAGVVLGTPQYMSPEACESKRDLDHRTDIYALGVLLFQMTTGSLPFDGGSMGEILVKHVTQAPPVPRAINGAIPPSVEQIILRCLAKSPDGRFPTMAALRDALLDPDRYLMSSPPVMPAAPTASTQAQTMFMENAYAATAAMPPLGAGGAAAPAGRGDAARDLPLAAPAPSIVGALRPGSHADPFSVGGAALAKTAFLDGPGGASVGQGPTAEQVAASRRSTAVPGMPPPAAPVNQTMVIATPPGYKARPPRKASSIVVGIVLILAVVGGGIALLLVSRSGDGADTARELAAGTGSPGAAVGGGGAGAASGSAGAVGVAGSGSPDPGHGSGGATVTPMARVHLASEPDGADVFDGAGELLGHTPADVLLPANGASHQLVFRHPKTRERTKTVVVTGDQTVRVVLEPLPPGTGEAAVDAGPGRAPMPSGKPDAGSGAPAVTAAKAPGGKGKAKSKAKGKDPSLGNGTLKPDF